MDKNGLSIIVPTWNEEGNIDELLKRIDFTMRNYEIPYEVIFVDDNSTDSTRNRVEEAKLHYPVKLYVKIGKKGKAFSILEGYRYATFDIVAMIDGDLQYPPEYIPYMYNEIKNGTTDVVVANRETKRIGFIRKTVSNLYQIFFGHLLHGFDVDVQSGLKVFRKEIIQRARLSPTKWSFDLWFLHAARNGGYSIKSFPIPFERRNSGKSKVDISTGYELGVSAIKLKLEGNNIIPFTLEMEQKEGKGFHYKGKKYITHSELPHSKSALTRLTMEEIMLVILFIILFIAGLTINWHITIVIFVAIITFLYFVDLVFNFFLIIRSFRKSQEIVVSEEEINTKTDWPLYSIFCPLYKEWNVVTHFVDAMGKLDYPKDKLQILLLLEEDDAKTIEIVRSMTLPAEFEIIVVPDSSPKTKPKALNYGLIHARGEYMVIYDAEDRPEHDQLKKAVIAFEKCDPTVKCIQAKLNFYNAHQNILTRAFTAEYSLWFDLVLTGLQSINAPIPLGGTSNHFNLNDIKRLNGWDAFNVTEDCDLGMRVLKNGYHTAMLDSTTFEEANSNLFNWYKQRTRWIKGYIQTYLVHMRNPKEFFNKWSDIDLWTFQLIVGGKTLSMFINPFMWFITILYFVERHYVGSFIESFYPTPVLYMGLFSLIFGNFLYMYYYMIGCAKRGYDDLVKYGFLVPFYWLAMSFAAWKALLEFLLNPHYWYKTKHGLNLNDNPKDNINNFEVTTITNI
jgi:cellulose synthase/poly-beta-1,6-N-acetylglucosamine synthase-like glycosyltransferase